METTENFTLALNTLKFPVRYDRLQQTIWDADGLMVCDIRGWGKLQFMNKSEDRQDAIGELISNLLNTYHRIEHSDLDKKLFRLLAP